MKKFLPGLIFSLLIVFQFGCWGGGNDSNLAAANDSAGRLVHEFKDANEALVKGSKLLDENETEKAIEALRQAVNLDPDLAEAHFKLGIAYSLLETENKNEAVADETSTPTSTSKKAQEVKTNSEKAFEKAVEAYKKLIAKNPDDDVAHFNIGRAYNKLNEDEDAAKSLREAVRLKPDDTEYQTELGAIMIKLAKYAEAVPALKKALEIDPENSRAEGLLEDAEAGRKRIAFTAKKDDKKSANSNANANANIDQKLPEGNQKTEKPELKDKKPGRPANKPN